MPLSVSYFTMVSQFDSSGRLIAQYRATDRLPAAVLADWKEASIIEHATFHWDEQGNRMEITIRESYELAYGKLIAHGSVCKDWHTMPNFIITLPR